MTAGDPMIWPVSIILVMCWLGNTPVILFPFRDPDKQNARGHRPQAILMVGLAGFEPTTSRPPDGRATRLRYSPMIC